MGLQLLKLTKPKDTARFSVISFHLSCMVFNFRFSNLQLNLEVSVEYLSVFGFKTESNKGSGFERSLESANSHALYFMRVSHAYMGSQTYVPVFREE